MKTESLQPNDLAGYFREGIKSRGDFRVGIEWEKIGVYRENGKAIPYTGERGVQAIFGGLIKKYGWRPVLSGTWMTALEKESGSITLEPGGQIELSGQASGSLDENLKEIREHLEQIKMISEPMGVVWLGIGAQPCSVAEEMEWVPKPRYTIMRDALKSHGAMTYCMMKETASIQVSVDYESEADAILKLKLAMGLSPFLVALLANSPLLRGDHAGWLSRRALIWQNTAPERSGIIWEALNLEDGFQTYADYAMKVPMMFIERQGRWIRVDGISFLQFLDRGWLGHKATLMDWELHLSTIFTEARMKHYIEIRSIDCQRTPVGLAAAALIKGIFYSKEALEEAWKIVEGLSEIQLKQLHADAAKFGPKAMHPNGKPLSFYGQRLYELAMAGLASSEKHYLLPLKTYTERGVPPAEDILKCFDAKKPLVSCAAIED